MGIARSETGHITGPWQQEPNPLWLEDGGHGMIFRTFEGRLMLTFHSPNNSPQERPIFVELEETQNNIYLKSEASASFSTRNQFCRRDIFSAIEARWKWAKK